MAHVFNPPTRRCERFSDDPITGMMLKGIPQSRLSDIKRSVAETDRELREVEFLAKSQRAARAVSTPRQSRHSTLDEMILKAERVMAQMAPPALPVEIDTDSPLDDDVPKDPAMPVLFMSPLESDAAKFTRTTSGDVAVKLGSRTYTPDQILYCCQDAMRDGRVTGEEVMKVECAFHCGRMPDRDVLNRIMKEKK
jgi:hypothetical protein